MHALFSPEMSQAGAVKGLNTVEAIDVKHCPTFSLLNCQILHGHAKDSQESDPRPLIISPRHCRTYSSKNQTLDL